MNNRFLFYQTYAAYTTDRDASLIPSTSIVFVKDALKVITHGTEFECKTNQEAVETIAKALIYDGVDSTSTELALSANQGKVLNDTITALNDKLFDENGKIDPSLVDGVVGHVLGLENFVDANPDPVEDGKYYYNTTSKKILEGNSGAWTETDPQAGILYNRRGEDEEGRTNILYRWDGAEMAEVSASIALGETAGTAYEGSKGAANRAALDSAPAAVVTGFGAVTPSAAEIVITFTDSDKTTGTNVYAAGDGGNITIPAATDAAAGLMSAADKAALDALVGTGGDEQPSFPELVENVTNITNQLGDTTLTTTAQTVTEAINEIDAAVEALDAAAVKQVKIADNAAINPAEGVVTIPLATDAADGAMSAEDKKVLNALAAAAGVDPSNPGETVTPDAGEGELPNYEKPVGEPENPDIQAGDTISEALGKLEKKADDNAAAIEANKATIDAYTVNSKAISTNPVLNGADILLDGFAAAGASAAIASTDSVNAALAKLEALRLELEWHEGA